MSRELRCPNCGGEHTLTNPGITMLVCEYCNTVVYWDDETTLKMGAQSILPEADTRLFMHATGKLMDRGYEVVGRLRYDHGRGSWDEWYLQMDDGGVAWLSEDERELSLEQAAQIDGAPPPPDQLSIGSMITIEEVGYSVRELGQATCIGGEGQLPFTILPDERYPYADLVSMDGTRFATLEYDEGTTPHAFAGHVLNHQQLTIEDERPPSTAGGHEGKHIKCPNCDAPIEVTGEREVQTQSCEYCGAQNDLTGAQARVMAVNPEGLEQAFVFTIGQAGTFKGQPYEVCGRMIYEDYEGYRSLEYLLYNPEDGYLWLAEENGHYVLNQPTQQAPNRDPFHLSPHAPVTAGDTRFQFYESGTTRMIFVDGALPWLAKSGDTFQYADLVAPPRMLGVESDGKEIEYFFGTYMTPAEVYGAFNLEDTPPRPMGVHPAQPFLRGPVAKSLMLIGALFALLNLGLLGWSAGNDGKVIFNQTLTSRTYLAETLSQPFVVDEQKVMAMRIAAPLQNSWLALDVGLVDSKDNVVEEVSGDISYYSGVEGGESWSEGNRSTTSYSKSPKPGTYRLIFKATAGSNRATPGGEPLTITITQGAILSRYFLAMFIFALLFPLYEFTRKVLFEKRRWGPVTEDDDDDDY